MSLRPYQQDAFDAAKAFLTKCFDPCVIEAATGAGKSHIIASLAEWIHLEKKGNVLCLAPSKELVEQNREKYLLTGKPASIFSASAGSKCMRHPVIFGSPVSVLNNITKFKKIMLVVIDEAHGVTPTIRAIVDGLRESNPYLRVIGLTATPYRMGTGYIYAIDQSGNPVPEDQAKNPYFKRLVYRITARSLIEQGYLTPPLTEGHDGYSTESLVLNSTGKFDSKSIEVAFEGHGRKTAGIVAEIVDMSSGRMGVMIFAATLKHAEEVLASLPSSISAMVTGDTPKTERESILRRFKARAIKYLVNVQVLTTGFDASHVDVIAILRATESVGLLQQIIGRGLRLDNGKNDCLVLDYAENIERHCPDGDVFNPIIKVTVSNKESATTIAKCPDCTTFNEFACRPNPDGFKVGKDGYFYDLADNKLEIPSHFGRRCLGQTIVAGSYSRCDYRWTGKECPDCGAENDIAARYCSNCKCEIVDPNEKLIFEYKKLKKDPSARSTDKLLGWHVEPWVSGRGNKTVCITYTSEYRTFKVWYMPTQRKLWDNLCEKVYGRRVATMDEFIDNIREGLMPKTITVKKESSGFFKVYAHGEQEDALPPTPDDLRQQRLSG